MHMPKLTAVAMLVTATIAVVAVTLVAALALPASATGDGWGPQAAFLGRYHVTNAAAPRQSSATPAGIFTLAVSHARQLALNGERPTGGELTAFLRTYRGQMLPSAILSLRMPSGNVVLYLTELKANGSHRSAVINQAAFAGAPIGALAGTSTAPGTLTAAVHAQGLPTLALHFARFSSNPVP